jgi:hypothetical protein
LRPLYKLLGEGCVKTLRPSWRDGVHNLSCVVDRPTPSPKYKRLVILLHVSACCGYLKLGIQQIKYNNCPLCHRCTVIELKYKY